MRSLSCFSLSELTSMAMLTPIVGDNENRIDGWFQEFTAPTGSHFPLNTRRLQKTSITGSIGGGKQL
jgi:hypothetical protein